MKLTESRLKQFIKEELEQLNRQAEEPRPLKINKIIKMMKAGKKIYFKEAVKFLDSSMRNIDDMKDRPEEQKDAMLKGVFKLIQKSNYVEDGAEEAVFKELQRRLQKRNYSPKKIEALSDSAKEEIYKGKKPAAKPQPQAARRKNKIKIQNMRKGDFMVAIAKYPMRGKLRKQYAQAKIINGNLEAASKKATEEVRKRVEAMLASEPSNTQDQAALKKSVKSRTIARFFKNGPPDSPHGRNIKNAFEKPAPQAAAAAAEPVVFTAPPEEQSDAYNVKADVESTKAAAARYQASQLAANNSSAGEFDGLGTRSILRKKFPNEPIRKAFEKLKKLRFNDPARVAYRKAFKERNLT